MQGYIKVRPQCSFFLLSIKMVGLLTCNHVGIGPKVTQSVITAAFLFAFKDALYDLSVQLRRKVPAKLPLT